MTTVAQLTIEMAANVARLQKDMARVNSTVDGAMAKVRKSADFAMKAIGAIGGAVTIGALTSLVTNLGRTADELVRFSRLTNTTTTQFQELAFGARRFGVEQDKLADILKDTQDKVGDFIQTGGGAMADFFENIGPKVGVTADQFRDLNGADALQLYISSLEKANLSQADMVFYMEAIASDSTLLLPLFADNGAALEEMSKQARALGLVLSEETIAQAQQFDRTLGLLSDGLRGVGQTAAAELLPTLNSLTESFLKSFTEGDRLKGLSGALAGAMKIIASAIIVVVDAVRLVARSWAGFADIIVAIVQGRFSEVGGLIDDLIVGNLDVMKESIASVKTVWDDSAGGAVTAITTVNKSTSDLTTTTKEAEKAVKSQAKATKEATEAAKEFKRIQDEGRRVFEQTRTPIENANIELARLQSLLDQGAISWDTYGRAVFAVEDALEKVATAIPEDEKFLQAAEELMAANKDIADTFQDDLLNSIKTAFLQGGKFSEAFARGLKAELIEAFLDPALGNAINQAKSGNFAGIAGIVSAGSVGGSSGAGLSALLQNANGIAAKLVAASGATGQTAASMLQLGNNLSKIAPYAGSIAALVNGDVRGAAGSALGTYIGGAIAGPIGAAIGASLGGLFGGSNKISAQLLGNAEFQFSGNQITGAAGNAGGFVSDIVRDGSQRIADAYVNTVQALGGQAISQFSIAFGANTGRQGQDPQFGLGVEVGGRRLFTQAETKATDANTQLATIKATFALLQQTDFADNVDAVVRGIDFANSSFEQLNQTLNDAQTLASLNELFAQFDSNLNAISGASIQVVSEFLVMTGGVEGLGQNLASFTDLFFSESEKIAMASNQLNAVFSEIGQDTVPSTLSAYRDLIEGQDLLTESGRKAYASLLNLAPGFADVVNTLESALTQAYQGSLGRAPDTEGLQFYISSVLNGSQTLEQALAAIANSAEAAAFANQDSAQAIADNTAILSERADLERELFNLTATATEQLQAQRSALDESNRALFDQIQAVKAAQAAQIEAERVIAESQQRATAIANERLGLEGRLLQLQGDTTALRQLELDALDGSNRSILQQIFALQDAQAAQELVTQAQQQAADAAIQAAQDIAAAQREIANERFGLESRLLELQGNTNALRERELAALDDSNRSLLEQIFALQDAQAAQELATQAQQLAADAAQQAAEEILAQQRQIADERFGLEGRLLQLQGDTNALREREILALDESNRALLRQIFALEDAQKAAELAARLEQDRLGELERAQDDAAQAVNSYQDALRSVTETIVEEIDRLRGTSSDSSSLSSLQSQFAILNAQAKSGDLDALGKLPEFSRAIEAATLASAGSIVDVQRVRAQLANALQGTIANTGFAPLTMAPIPTGPIVQNGQQQMQVIQDSLISEVKGLRQQVATLITTAQQTTLNTGGTLRILDDVTQNGTTVRTTETTS